MRRRCYCLVSHRHRESQDFQVSCGRLCQAAYALQHPGSVLIESPDRNSFQNRLLEVRGTMRLPAHTEAQLWIIVRSDIRGDGTYYPQGYAQSDDIGRWSCVITLGSTRTDDDGRYEVIAALASPVAARKLRDFVQNELATSPDGMTDFPADGVDIKDERPLRRDSRVASQSGIQEHTGFC